MTRGHNASKVIEYQTSKPSLALGVAMGGGTTTFRFWWFLEKGEGERSCDGDHMRLKDVQAI